MDTGTGHRGLHTNTVEANRFRHRSRGRDRDIWARFKSRDMGTGADAQEQGHGQCPCSCTFGPVLIGRDIGTVTHEQCKRVEAGEG